MLSNISSPVIGGPRLDGPHPPCCLIRVLEVDVFDILSSFSSSIPLNGPHPPRCTEVLIEDFPNSSSLSSTPLGKPHPPS